MFLLLGCDHINNNDFLAFFFSLYPQDLDIVWSTGISQQTNTHWPEDMVVVGLGIRDNVDLNREGAPRDQFWEKERCKET